LSRVFALVVIVGAVAAAGASGAPQRDDRIRHGVGIGRIELGMTYSQVRRILGGPQTVNRRERLRDGRRYIEFSWDFGWWTVGFVRGRVAMVETANVRERTPEGLGVDSTLREVRRELRRVRCVSVHPRAAPDNTRESRCAYTGRRGRQTLFLLSLYGTWRNGFEPWVTSVRVQERFVDLCIRGPYFCEPR
jgi:hypothetical protein